MATESLFNESIDELLKRARINTADDDQTVALIEMSVSDVRIGFRKYLGADRIAAIVAMDLVKNPVTDNEYIRAQAANIEVLWLTWFLIPRLPQYFMDNGNSVNNAFNLEPLTRESDSSTMQKRLDLLWAQIESGLSDLVVNEEDFTSSTFRASSIGPEEDYLFTSPLTGYTGSFL